MASRGFVELLRLADLAKARATGRGSIGGSEWYGIAFEVAGIQMVAPMGEVAEILNLPSFTPIPLTKPWLMGVANVRGRLLTLIDLANFLTLSTEVAKSGKIMVIDQEGIFTGILVDQVFGMVHFSEAQYQSIELPEVSVAFAPYHHGAFIKDDKAWHVMMLSLLYTNPDYLNAAVI